MLRNKSKCPPGKITINIREANAVSETSKFTVTFQSDLSKVRRVLSDAMEYVHETCPYVSRQDWHDIRLILSELLHNAVIHGNKRDPGKHILVEIEPEEDGVSCLIRDEGTGFDPKKYLASAEPCPEYLPENGRGIRIVHSLADELAYNSVGNEIWFHKRMSGNG